MAGILDLNILQGVDFSRTITLKDDASTAINLTGYTARAQIRKTARTEVIAATLSIEFAVDRTTGVFSIGLTNAQTSELAVTGNTYAQTANYTWDLELIDAGGIVTRLLNGNVTVSPEVTR